MDIKVDSCESSERKEKCRVYYLRECIYHHEHYVIRYIKIKDTSSEISDKNEKHAIGNWSKGDPFLKVAKNLAKLCSTVWGKVDLFVINLET